MTEPLAVGQASPGTMAEEWLYEKYGVSSPVGAEYSVEHWSRPTAA